MYTDECVYRYIFAICIIPCIFIHTQLDIVRNLVKQRLGAQWAWLLYVCKGTWSIASHRQPLIVQAQKQQGMPWSRVAAQTFSVSAQLGFRDFLPNQVLMESGHVCCDPWCRSWCSCCCRALPTRLHTTRGGGVCCSYKVVRSANTNSWIVTRFSLVGWVVGKNRFLWVIWPFRSTVRVTPADCFWASRLLCSVPGYETWGAGGTAVGTWDQKKPSAAGRSSITSLEP